MYRTAKLRTIDYYIVYIRKRDSGEARCINLLRYKLPRLQNNLANVSWCYQG